MEAAEHEDLSAERRSRDLVNPIALLVLVAEDVLRVGGERERDFGGLTSRPDEIGHRRKGEVRVHQIAPG